MIKSRAQTTLEYTILTAVIIGALIAMQVYMKRGIQGKMRSDLNQLTDGAFYSPGATNSTSISITNIEESSYTINRVTESALVMNQVTNRSEEIASFGSEPMRRQR